MLHQRACVFLIGVLCMLSPAYLGAASLSGRVLSVQSGNQISLSLAAGGQRSVRLIGLDPPQPRTSMALASKRQLRMLIAGRQISVVYRTLTPEGEILGQVLHGGADINLRMLKTGMAHLNPDKNLPQQDLVEYRKAQTQAQIRQLGIWAKTRY
jgi:endonuclease YncB( thermonuclease family)